MARRRRTVNLGTFGEEKRGPDVSGFLAEDAAAGTGDPYMDNLAAALTVQRNREAMQMAGDNPRPNVGGPLPDMGWDAFFGSLQAKEARAGQHGLRFNANLAGNGPGQGIGHLAIRLPDGTSDHPLDTLGDSPSLAGLRMAATRIARRR